MEALVSRLSGLTPFKAILISAILGLIYFVQSFDSGSRLDEKYQSLKAEFESEATKAKETESTLKVKEEVLAETTEASSKYDDIVAKLPTEVNPAEVLMMVDSLAKAAGVEVKSKEPRPPIKSDVVDQLPLRVVIEGRFTDLMIFFYYVSTLQRITSINSVIIQPLSVAKDIKLKAEAILMSYRFSSPKTASTEGGKR